MRVLVDSNVLLRAVISPAGPARALLREIRNHDNHGLVLSEFIIEEVQRILAEPRIRKRLRFEADTLSVFFGEVSAVAEIVQPEPSPTIISDANDRPVLDAAITAGNRRERYGGPDFPRIVGERVRVGRCAAALSEWLDDEISGVSGTG